MTSIAEHWNCSAYHPTSCSDYFATFGSSLLNLWTLYTTYSNLLSHLSVLEPTFLKSWCQLSDALPSILFSMFCSFQAVSTSFLTSWLATSTLSTRPRTRPTCCIVVDRITMDVDKPMIELCAVSMLPSTHFVQLAVFLSIIYIHMIRCQWWWGRCRSRYCLLFEPHSLDDKKNQVITRSAFTSMLWLHSLWGRVDVLFPSRYGSWACLIDLRCWCRWHQQQANEHHSIQTRHVQRWTCLVSSFSLVIRTSSPSQRNHPTC